MQLKNKLWFMKITKHHHKLFRPMFAFCLPGNVELCTLISSEFRGKDCNKQSSESFLKWGKFLQLLYVFNT